MIPKEKTEQGGQGAAVTRRVMVAIGLAMLIPILLPGGPTHALAGTDADGAASPERPAVGAVVAADRGETGLSSLSFDAVAEGRIPPGWKIDATNATGKLAAWAVTRDADAPSAPQVLSLTAVNDRYGGVFNLIWNPAAGFQDGEIEVKARANTGEIDQGGGVIWRARDADNYYIARYNPLEENFRLYYVKDGGRKMLASKNRLNVKTGAWFTIKIVQRGKMIEGWLNGKKLLETTDSTFLEAGGVGIWSKADAATSFDDFRVVFAHRA